MADSIVISSLLSVIKSLSHSLFKHFQLSSANNSSSGLFNLPLIISLAFAVSVVPSFVPFTNLFDHTYARFREAVSYLKRVGAS